MNLKYATFEASKLGRLPGVRAVFLSGSHAQGRAKPDSDYDLFIVAKHGQIWTARFFVYTRLLLNGKMRRPGKTKGKFCPNHFISEDCLEIQEKDVYSANLFSHNIPLYDPNNIFVQFVEVNKAWWKQFGCHPKLDLGSSQKMNSPKLDSSLRWNDKGKDPSAALRFAQDDNKKTGALEKFLQKIQKKKILQNPESKLPGAKIVLTDTELRFHPRPKNKEYLQSKK